MSFERPRHRSNAVAAPFLAGLVRSIFAVAIAALVVDLEVDACTVAAVISACATVIWVGSRVAGALAIGSASWPGAIG
jgi:hypothetical protein